MSLSMEDLPRPHRITVDEYHRMAEVGLLAVDARVELVEGEIIDMAPIGNAHRSVVVQLNRLLTRAVGDEGIVLVQDAVRLNNRSEPQPDLAILKPRKDFYAGKFPAPGDVILLIEVSDTTLKYDREIKVPLYARTEIPEVWLFDLTSSRVHFFRKPAGGAYLETASTQQPGITALSSLPGVSVDLSGVLIAR